MKVRECLDRAVRLELQAKKVYETLALRHADAPDLRQVFLSLALEEEHHADRLRALGRHMTEPELAREVPPELRVAMQEMAADLDGILAQDEAGGAGEPAGVLARVTELERRHVVVHAENLCQLFAPSMEGLFAALARHDSQHRRLLESAVERSRRRGPRVG